MREYLFKGTCIDDDNSVIGDLIHRRIWRSDVILIRVHDDGFDQYEEYEVDPDSVGQYSGYADVHGTKLFEKDRCAISRHGTTEHGSILFIDGCFCFVSDAGAKTIRLAGLISNGYEITSREVRS